MKGMPLSSVRLQRPVMLHYECTVTPFLFNYSTILFYVRRTWRNFIVERREHLSSYAPGACYFQHFAAIAVFERMYRSTRHKNKCAWCAQFGPSITGDFNASFNHEK